MTPALKALFSPRSIVVVGASTDFDKISGRPLKALVDKGFAGKLYAVNPKYREIAGVPCLPDIGALPEGVDLAIVAVPAKRVAASIRALGARGVRAAVVFSSGFGEMGEAGHALETELAEALHTSGVRMVGPNCLGLINAFEDVMATFTQFSAGPTQSGPVAFVTQSGALGTATAAMARRRGLHFGYFVNTGNELDVRFVEAMGALLPDERIRAGAGYLEGVKDGPGLVALGEAALAMGKPLALTKVGRTRAGARAIASHTGSLAGEDAVFEGILHQCGILRARSDEHLLDLMEVLVHGPVPEGTGVAIITRSGGAGALMADRAEELGLDVAVLTEETRTRLKGVVPVFGSLANPVDITAQGLVDPSIMRETMRIVLEDPGVHAAVVWLAFTEKHADVTVDTFVRVKKMTRKPFVVSWVGAPESAQTRLREEGIALLRGAEPAVDALAGLIRYGQSRRQWMADAPARASLSLPAPQLPAAGGIVGSLDAAAALSRCGVPLCPVKLARTDEEAVAAADTLGYPVALKIESRDVPHKTDAGGVKLALRDADAVRSAYAAVTASVLAKHPEARIDGVLVQAMAPGDVELVVGLQRDPVFGTVVMVGLGGIFVEVLRDVAFRKAPVTPNEALRMLGELRSGALLDGARGKAPVDRAAVAQFVSTVSCFGAAAADRLLELDLNPVLAGPAGCVAVDWLMVLDPS
jgi:acyl-CoA synthetase (NDP forming)